MPQLILVVIMNILLVLFYFKTYDIKNYITNNSGSIFHHLIWIVPIVVLTTAVGFVDYIEYLRWSEWSV